MSGFKERILITGGCGFIGSHFVNHYFYENSDCHIINIDAMYYCASQENVLPEIRDSSRYTFIRGNLCSLDFVSHILDVYQVTRVVHFAAQSHVQNSFEDSLQYTNDNVLGTHTLLEACRRYSLGAEKIQKFIGGIQKFIHISTDEVYGESMLSDSDKKTEESVLCPTNPYAATKAAAELIAQSYYHSFKMPILITRGNNVYGPNQYPEKLIPKFIQQLKTGENVTIQGDGTNVRAFLHVKDVCRALTLVLEKGETGEIYNIGSDEDSEYSVLEIARMLVKMVFPDLEDVDKKITYVEDRPFNDKRYYISNDKVKKLGWEIEVDFMEGLRGV
jgi:dTDP-glucose 4,6-dehydratase